jgi:hypothetical protein
VRIDHLPPKHPLRELHETYHEALVVAGIEVTQVNLGLLRATLDALRLQMNARPDAKASARYWKARGEPKPRAVRGLSDETKFCLGLLPLYKVLSGRDGISDEGPFYRFAAACGSVAGIWITPSKSWHANFASIA